jgi:hypothetical protein
MDTGIQSTQHGSGRAALIDQLVDTYRELNTHVRRLPEERLTAGGEEGSVRSVIARMRIDEMRFAQALKERITGVVHADLADKDPVIGTEHRNDTTVMLISQFGTARETTLNLLKNLTDEDWTKQTDDGKSIQDHVQDLVASDRNQLQRIKQLLT